MTSPTALESVLGLIRSLDGRADRTANGPNRITTGLAGSSGNDSLDIDPAAPWRDIGVDSLDLLSLITLAEDAFGIAIPDAQVVRMHTPLALADWVARHTSG